VTFEINGHEYTHEQAYFASVDEFTKAWPHHRRARKDGMVGGEGGGEGRREGGKMEGGRERGSEKDTETERETHR